MTDFYEKCISICAGIIASIFGVDYMILLVWFGLIIIDIVTGIAKAKLIKDPITSTKMTDGFTRKLVPMLFVFGFHWAAVATERAYGFSLSAIPTTFAMFYIVGELKSILENLQQGNILLPDKISERVDQLFNTANKK